MSTPKTSKSNAPRRPAPAAESAPEAVQAPAGAEAPAEAPEEPQALIVPPAARPALDRGQIDLIRRTICNGATDEEFQLFVMQCQRTGLDPFSRQIHAVKRRAKERDAQGREVWVDRLSIQVGIDGFRLVADRTRQTDGQDGPFWCGPDGVWRDVWLEQGPPAACKVVVYRKGQSHGYVGVARYSEYAQGGPMWQKMPAGMIAKCAEGLALRKAFPAELSGLYTRDELPEEQEQQPAATAPEEAPSDFLAKLQKDDAARAAEGICTAGDLVKCVAAMGKRNGYPADMTAWNEAQIVQARAVRKDFVERHNLVAELLPLLERKGATAGQVNAKLGLPVGTGLHQLSADQLRKALACLQEMDDAQPAPKQGGRKSA